VRHKLDDLTFYDIMLRWGRRFILKSHSIYTNGSIVCKCLENTLRLC